MCSSKLDQTTLSVLAQENQAGGRQNLLLCIQCEPEQNWDLAAIGQFSTAPVRVHGM